MGRKKIEIRRLADDRNRQVTFLKRKAGLMKKAWELSVLCSADVAVIVFSQNDKAFEFCSSNIDDVLIRYTEHKGPIEHKDPADFAAAAAADSGNPLPDSDDGEDDGEDEPAAKKGKKAPAPKGGKKPPANTATVKKRQSSTSVILSQAAGSPSSLDQPPISSTSSSAQPSSSYIPRVSSQNSNYSASTIVPPQQPPISHLHSSSHPPPPSGRYGPSSHQPPAWQPQQQSYANGMGGYAGGSYADQNGASGSGRLWGDGGLNGARQSSGTPQPMMNDSMFRGQNPSPFGPSSSHNQSNPLSFLFNNQSSSSSNPHSYYSSDQLWNPNAGYNAGLLNSQLLQQHQYLQQQVQQTQQQNQQHPLYSHPMLLAAAAAAAAVQNGPGLQSRVPESSLGIGSGFSWPITGGPSANNVNGGMAGLERVGTEGESSSSNLPSVSTTTQEEIPDWQSGSPLLPGEDYGEVRPEDGDELGSGLGGDSASEEDEDGDEGDDGGDDDYVEGGKRRKSGGSGGAKRVRVE